MPSAWVTDTIEHNITYRDPGMRILCLGGVARGVMVLGEAFCTGIPMNGNR